MINIWLFKKNELFLLLKKKLTHEKATDHF